MNILVYPFSTEIAFEIHQALYYVKNITLYGGADNYNNHGLFVFKNIIPDLPFISDDSTEADIIEFEEKIKTYNIDMIYPAMDGVIYKFSQFKNLFKEKVIVPDFKTASITRSKAKTYQILKETIPLPKQYKSAKDVTDFPVFVKPDVGQGSVGAKKINSREELEQSLSKPNNLLILEYLPGEEYTVDCFTNIKGELVCACPRKRLRMKNGISMACEAIEDSKILEIAVLINKKIQNKGGWFFQLKKRKSEEYVLLEVSSRIGGTSAFTRALGVNLPLLTVNSFCGQYIDAVPLIGHKNLKIDRALSNSFKTDLTFNAVYIDYDDTLVVNGHLNLQLITFLFKCIDMNIPCYLLTKHDDKENGTLTKLIQKYRLKSVFDKIIHLNKNQEKFSQIKEKKSILIDDSYGERQAVHKALGIPVFDPSMIESLL